MVKRFFIFSLVVALILTGTGLEKKPAYADSTTPDSIYFTSAEMDALRLLQTSPSHSTVWNNLSTWADANISDSPPGPASDKVAWLRVGHEVRHYIETMGFMYAMTDNTAYADAALGWMETVASWSVWGDPSSERFNEAEFLRGFSFGYSVFSDYMTAGQKTTILNALASHTVEVYNKLIAMYPPTNGYPNHWGTLAGCLGLSALAIGPDHADSPTWLSVATTYTQLLISWGGEDGGWFEGPGYTMSLFSHVVPFLDALKRAGTDLFSGSSFLANHAYYYIYLSNTLSLEVQGELESLMGVEDYEEKLGYEIDVPGVNTLDFMYRFATEYNNGYFQRFADLHSAQDEIQSYIWRSPTLTSLPLPGLPETRRFAGIGYVVMKNGWGDNDLNIVFKSGRSIGHALSSQNEFTIYFNGKKLTGAPGYVNNSYENNTFAHNSLLVNGLGQYWEPQSGGDVGVIEEVYAGSPYYSYARGNASAVYPGGGYGRLTEWLRHFVLVDDAGFIVIYDDITAPYPSRYEWLLNEKRLPVSTAWQAGLEPSSMAVEGDTVTITKTGAKLEAQILEPASFLYDMDHFSISTGWYTHDYDYIKVRPAVEADEAEFLTVLFPMSAAGSSLPAEKIGSGNAIGAKVTDGDTVYLVLFSTDGNPVAEYIELGAYFQAADGNTYLFDGTRILAEFDNFQVMKLVPLTGDNAPPVLDPIGNRFIDEGEFLEIIVSATDPNNDPLTFSADLSPLPAGAIFDPATATFSWTPGAGDDGTFTHVRFTVSDGVLTDSEDITIAVNETNEAPVLDPVGGKIVDEGELLQIVLSASDPDNDPLFYSADLSALPAGAGFNPASATFYWTPGYGDAGTYGNVRFTVSDGGMSDYEDITITVNDVNGPPVLAAIGSKSVIEGALIEFTVQATDPDNDPLFYSADLSPLPGGATFDEASAVFRWATAAGDAGTYTNVRFTVSDGEDSDSEYVTITVSAPPPPPPPGGGGGFYIPPNHPPVLDQIGDRTVIAGRLLEIQVSAADPDSDALTFTAVDLPSGARFDSNTRLFSWKPTDEQSGVHTGIHFEVSDGRLKDYEDISITVMARHYPELSPIGDKIIAEGEILSFEVSATDLDGDTLIYQAQDLPPGAEFDTDTGRFRWMPSPGTAGVYPNVYFIVSDGELAVFEAITITVQEPDKTPPAIYEVIAFSASADSAVIYWTTDEPSTSQIKYWASPISFSPVDENLVTNHKLSLSDLVPGTTYYFETISRDKQGNITTSSQSTFTTPVDPGGFTVSDVEINSLESGDEEKIQICVHVFNEGDSSNKCLVSVFNNAADEVYEQVVELDAGCSKSLLFDVCRQPDCYFSVNIVEISGSLRDLTAMVAEENMIRLSPYRKITEMKSPVTIEYRFAGIYTVNDNLELFVRVSLDGLALESVPVRFTPDGGATGISGELEYIPADGWNAGVYSFQAFLYDGDDLLGQTDFQEVDVSHGSDVQSSDWIFRYILIGGGLGAILSLLYMVLYRRRLSPKAMI